MALGAALAPAEETLKIHTAVELEMTTETGAIYELQSSDDMAAWTTEETFEGTGGTTFLFRSTRGDDKRFWRLHKGFVLIPAGNFEMGDAAGGWFGMTMDDSGEKRDVIHGACIISGVLGIDRTAKNVSVSAVLGHLGRIPDVGPALGYSGIRRWRMRSVGICRWRASLSE